MRGYETAGAGDGVDALAYLRSGERASLIILDMLMPNMDGATLRRALKADARWYSAFPPEDLGDAVGVIRKATTGPEALLALVDRACGTA